MREILFRKKSLGVFVVVLGVFDFVKNKTIVFFFLFGLLKKKNKEKPFPKTMKK